MMFANNLYLKKDTVILYIVALLLSTFSTMNMLGLKNKIRSDQIFFVLL